MSDRPPQHELREDVLERDSHSCQYCGKHQPDGVGLEVHHIHRHVDGGPDEEENAVTLCEPHHSILHSLGEGETRPLSLLEEHDVPTEIPRIRGLDDPANLMVMDVLKESKDKEGEPWGLATPLRIQLETGLTKQRVNDALGSLVDAGWVEQPEVDGEDVHGIYKFVADPREEVDRDG